MAWDSKPVWPEKYPQEIENQDSFASYAPAWPHARLASTRQGKCMKAGVLWSQRVADVSMCVCARGSESAPL